MASHLGSLYHIFPSRFNLRYQMLQMFNSRLHLVNNEATFNINSSKLIIVLTGIDSKSYFHI